MKSFFFIGCPKWIGGVVFVDPMTDVDGGDKLKFDHNVFTGLAVASSLVLELNFWDTKSAILEIKCSFEVDFLFEEPEPDCIKILSVSLPLLSSSSSPSSFEGWVSPAPLDAVKDGIILLL